MTSDFLKDSYEYIFKASFFFLFIFLCERIYSNKLTQIPGPFYTAVSKIPILYQTYKGNRNNFINELHKKYGEIVRLSPNEISISDAQYINIIYTRGNFNKTSFYSFENYNVSNMFSTKTKEEHIKIRKPLTMLYSKSAVSAKDNQNHVMNVINNLIESVKKNGDCIDVLELFKSMALDVVVGFEVGWNIKYNSVNNKKQREIIHYFSKCFKNWFWTSYFPNYFFTSPAVKFAYDTTEEWNDELIEEANYPKGSTAFQLKNNTNNNGKYEIASEILDHIAAGHETTGLAMTYLCWHLGNNKNIMERLQKEIFNYKNKNDITYSEIDKLPYLNGVIQETLRLYTPIPASEPRIVPEKGLLFHRKYIIPANTIISMQPYTMHRDENVFQNPLEFLPERWIINENNQEEKENYKRMLNSFMPFGAGVRMCLGMNIALMEMKLATFHLFKQFTIIVPPQTTEQSMAVLDQYTIGVSSDKCVLSFVKLD